MTPEERDIISRFVARVGGAPQSITGGNSSQTQGNLPPIDPEADRFIGEQFATHPEARYRVVQMAFVQEAALAEAQNRIKRLEYELNQQRQAPPQQARGGLFGGLFGSGQAQAPQYQQPQYAPPPQPSYPPSYQPGMFGQGGMGSMGGGSGFLGGALRTAAGVAGGVLAADAISSMFSGGHGGFGGGFGGGGFGGGGFGGGEIINETTVNNYGDQAAPGGADPWSGAGTAPDAGQSDAWSGSGGGGDAGGDAWSGGGDTGGGDSGWSDSGGGGGGNDDTF